MIGAQYMQNAPQGLKPSILLDILRHPSAPLRAGLKAVPFQSNEMIVLLEPCLFTSGL